MLTAPIKDSSIRRHLIRSASGSLLFKISGTFLTLLSVIILARILGVKGFGIYAFSMSVAQILTIPAMLGGQQLLVRDVAAYQSRDQFKLLKGLIVWIRRSSFLVSCLLSLLAGISAFFFCPGSRMFLPLLIGLALVPCLANMQLNGSALRGLQRILLGQVADVLRPLLLILMVGLYFLFAGSRISPELALMAQFFSIALMIVLTWLILRKSLPVAAKSASVEYETGRWMRSALPFILAGSMQILNKEVSVALLGALQGAEQAGLYRVAQRGAEFVPFGLVAVNMAIGPTLSRLYVQGRIEYMQRLVSKSVLAVLAFGLPLALLLILGGKWIIPLVFGPGFSAAYMVLVILCLGQLFNAAMGSVGLILNMTGLERFTAKGVTVAALVNIVGNIIMIPFYGAIGAAMATSLSLVLWNVLLSIWLYREIGIVSFVKRS